MRKRLLMAHPRLDGMGGASAVAAWALEALKDEYEITLATLAPVEAAWLNQKYGTALAPSDFEIRVAPQRFQKVHRWVPTQGALVELSLMARWARELDRTHRFDRLLSTINEIDFGRRAVQYVHFPWVYLPRPEIEMRWYHRVPGVLNGYRRACQKISGGTMAGLRRNVTLANSEFVAQKIKDAHGIDSTVVFPPVPGDFPAVPWEDRRFSLVSLGRVHPTKRWEMAIEIVDRLRKHGIEVEYTLIGQPDDRAYYEHIVSLANARPWMRLESNLAREQLAAELPRHRFGLHTMEEEHFGIAVAEMVKAGCITFVHDSGGAVEIVGRLGEVRFATVAEGAEKLAAVLLNPGKQQTLRKQFADFAQRFSTDRFGESLRETINRTSPI